MSDALATWRRKLDYLQQQEGFAQDAVTYADRDGKAFARWTKRATHADALHQTGRPQAAKIRFAEAENILAQNDSDNARLYSPVGFRYCDFLLAPCENIAWRNTIRPRIQNAVLKAATTDCHSVSQRAHKSAKLANFNGWILAAALDDLTLIRAAL